MLSMKVLCNRNHLEKDKGYAYIIMVLSMISHGFHMGFGLAMVGNMTIAHQKFFHIDVHQSGLISTAHVATTFLFGPVASLLVKKFGCQLAAIVGGCCMICGFAGSSFSTQPWHAFLLYGLVAGAGISCLLVSTSEILSIHFDKKKYFAFSVVILGQYVGMFFWPSFSQMILDQQGYVNAMRILGSFHVIHIIIGVFLIEPITEISVKEKVLNKVVRRTASSAEVSSYRFTNDKAMQVYTVSSTPKDQVDEMKSIAVIPEVCFRREDDNHSTCILKSCLKLFRSHQVWLMMLNGAFWGGSSGSFLVFTNEFIVNKLGLTEDEAALGVSIIGVTEIFGTGLVTFTSQFEFDRAILHSCTMIGLGISPLLAAVCFNKGMFYMLCIVWGLSDGACIANFLGYVYGFCQPDLLALLMGMNLLAQGAAIAMVSPIVGYLMQTVRAEYGILMSGLCAIAAAFVLLPVIVQRRKATRNYNMEENQRKH